VKEGSLVPGLFPGVGSSVLFHGLKSRGITG